MLIPCRHRHRIRQVAWHTAPNVPPLNHRAVVLHRHRMVFARCNGREVCDGKRRGGFPVFICAPCSHRARTKDLHVPIIRDTSCRIRDHSEYVPAWLPEMCSWPKSRCDVCTVELPLVCDRKTVVLPRRADCDCQRLARIEEYLLGLMRF